MTGQAEPARTHACNDARASVSQRGACEGARCAPAVRQEIADYMVERAQQQWFQEVMALCQEITQEDIDAVLRLERAAGVEEPVRQPAPCPAAAEHTGMQLAPRLGTISQELMDAVKWATGVRDDGVLLVICDELRPAEREEQIQQFRSREAERPKESSGLTLVAPALLASRAQVAACYHDYLIEAGWTAGTRLPSCRSVAFLRAWDWGPWEGRSQSQKLRSVRRWHAAWQLGGAAGAVLQARTGPQGTRRGRKPAGAQALALTGRRRSGGGGRHRKCAWLRQKLFEWWSAMRHSVDWKAIKRGCPELSREPKKLARFTQAMLRQKANELICCYCAQKLKAGQRARVPKLTSGWWQGWRREYGLSMRHPNRRFKVSLSTLKERLERGWLNVFRVRAACEILRGYDMEMENWDQSPFHHNETGSANTKTLTVAGRTVPLLEGHADTRLRWSANFVTWSDHKRVKQQGPPPMECMFRAEGGGATLRPRLESHLRSRGYDPWVSASASGSGSYKTPDVLAFLKRHLPPGQPPPGERNWRIMLADDAGAHLSPLVKKLCWERGYVYIVHGGGVTPVVQTVDTDFNQSAKRKYMAKEGAVLLRQMQLGKVVPSLRPIDCIDLMVQVCSETCLHLAGADGYVRTGLKANLHDADLDKQIVKEAGYFWRVLGMREKVKVAVQEVREEAEAGRLRWCYEDIHRLVLPHPRKAKDDDVLDRIGDYYGSEPVQDQHGPEQDHGPPLEDGEDVGEGPDGGGAASPEGSGEEDGDEADEGWADEEDLRDWSRAPGDQDDQGGAPPAAAGAPGFPAGVTKAQAEEARQCNELSALYERLAGELRAHGDISGAAVMELSRDKERRRERELCQEDPGVLRALAHLEDEQKAYEYRLKRQFEDAHEMRLQARHLEGETKRLKRELQSRKAQVVDAEATLHARQHVKQVSLEDLGSGRTNCGNKAGKQARTEVLRRLSRLGEGVSTQQRAEFQWFCDRWDARGLADYGQKWPEVFSTWLQEVLSAHERGEAAAFSQFMRRETERWLAGELALRLPAEDVG